MDPPRTAEEQARLRAILAAAQQTVPDLLPAATVAARLVAAREAKGWSPNQLAAAAQVSRSVVIWELETGSDRARNPITLVKLARTLDQPWDYLGAAAPPRIAPGPGRALMTARIAHGWAIRDLAAASGVGASTIHGMEHGRRGIGQERTWTDLARALGVPVADLYPQPFAPARRPRRTRRGAGGAPATGAE